MRPILLADSMHCNARVLNILRKLGQCGSEKYILIIISLSDDDFHYQIYNSCQLETRPEFLWSSEIRQYAYKILSST